MSDFLNEVKGLGLEIPADEPVDTKTDPIKETPKEEPKGEPVNDVKTDPVFDLGAFNKKFSKEFDETTLTEYLSKADRYDELERTHNEFQQKYSELETVARRVTNPLEYFASEDEYIRQQFLKNKASQFSEESMSVLAKLTPSSIDKLNPWEALKTDMLVSNPDLEGGMDAVDELLRDKYGIEGDYEQQDTKAKNLIKIDAKNAKANLKRLYEGIEVPKAVNIEESRTQLRDAWDTPLKQMVEGLNKIKVAEGLDFTVTGEMKKGLEEELMTAVLNGWVRPSKDSASELMAYATDKLLMRNMDTVISHITKTKEVELREKIRAELENRAPLNNESKEGKTNDQKAVVDFLLK